MRITLPLRLRWWAICYNDGTVGYWPERWVLLGFGTYWDGHYKIEFETATGWGCDDVAALLSRSGFRVLDVGLARPYPWFSRKYSYSEAWGSKAL